MNLTFKHCDNDDSYISLHDCYASKIGLKENTISFYFENGFWVLPEHCNSNLDYTARTALSKVDFIFEKEFFDEFFVSIFRKNVFNKTIMEEWNIKKLIELVNDKKCSLEFLYQYKNAFVHLFECCLHFDKKPYFCDCQLKIPATEVCYYWNELCFDKKW